MPNYSKFHAKLFMPFSSVILNKNYVESYTLKRFIKKKNSAKIGYDAVLHYLGDSQPTSAWHATFHSWSKWMIKWYCLYSTFKLQGIDFVGKKTVVFYIFYYLTYNSAHVCSSLLTCWLVGPLQTNFTYFKWTELTLTWPIFVCMSSEASINAHSHAYVYYILVIFAKKWVQFDHRNDRIGLTRTWNCHTSCSSTKRFACWHWWFTYSHWWMIHILTMME